MNPLTTGTVVCTEQLKQTFTLPTHVPSLHSYLSDKWTFFRFILLLIPFFLFPPSTSGILVYTMSDVPLPIPEGLRVLYNAGSAELHQSVRCLFLVLEAKPPNDILCYVCIIGTGLLSQPLTPAHSAALPQNWVRSQNQPIWDYMSHYHFCHAPSS